MKTFRPIFVAALLAAPPPALLNAQTTPPPGDAALNTTAPAADTLAGTIREVTLYQGTALVSRQVMIPGELQGPVELVVGPLPTTTQPETVYADLVKGAVVRSVACRSHPLDEKARMLTRAQEVAKEIRALKAKMAVGRNEIALRRIRQEYLRELQKFVAPATSQEMTHGVLQSKELEAVRRGANGKITSFRTSNGQVREGRLYLTVELSMGAKPTDAVYHTRLGEIASTAERNGISHSLFYRDRAE